MKPYPAPPPADHHLTVEERGTPIAQADVSIERECVCVTFHLDAGHLPVGVRPELVDSVFSLPDIEDHSILEAAIPLGDTVLLDALRERCSSVTTRAAGATCLIEGTIEHCDRCNTPEHAKALRA